MLIGLTPYTIAGILEKLRSRNFDEPIGTLEECDTDKLISSLRVPFLRPELPNRDKDFCDKAANLFFLLIENHSFSNSNKRVAVAALITFADINGYKINISEISLYALSMCITLLSKYGLADEAKQEVVNAISNALQKKPGRPLSADELNKLEDEFIEFMQS